MSRFFSFFLLILRIEAEISTLFPKKDSPQRETTSYPLPVNTRKNPRRISRDKEKRKKHI